MVSGFQDNNNGKAGVYLLCRTGRLLELT